MAGNVGKLTFWTTINTCKPKQVKAHPVKAWLQDRRNNWLVYRNEHITLASAKVAPPKPYSRNPIRKCYERVSVGVERKVRSQGSVQEQGSPKRCRKARSVC